MLRRGRRSGALVVKDFAAACLFLGRDAGGIFRLPGRHGQPSLHCRPFGHFFEPSFEVREFVQVDTLLLPGDRPGEGRYIRNRVFVASQVTAIIECRSKGKGERKHNKISIAYVMMECAFEATRLLSSSQSRF